MIKPNPPLGPISNVFYNPTNKTFLTFSRDDTVCVWSEMFVPLQTFQVPTMGLKQVSSVCYNVFNNEIVVANYNIATCMERGTVSVSVLINDPSHPRCAALSITSFTKTSSLFVKPAK